MQTSTQKLGRYGEEVATHFLLQLGWQIIDRNWRGNRVELDIIALDGDTIVFCEVKTRRGATHGLPAEAVTATKLNNIRRAALEWLTCHDKYFSRIRIDVIGITVPTGKDPHIAHIRGVD